MKQLVLGLVLSTFLGLNAFSTDLFWVNGPGNWSDSTNHWSLTSGGAPNATLPKAGDNVIFDNNSGLLTILSTVTVDTIILADTLDFSGMLNQFNMDATVTYDHVINASILGNTFGIDFTGTWGEIHMNAPAVGEIIDSQNITWIQDFRVIGAAIELSSDLNLTNGDLYIDNGGLVSNGFDIDIGSFFSTTTNTRNIDLGTSLVNVSEGDWQIDGTNLTSSLNLSDITLGDQAGVANFFGGDQTYGDVTSTSATTTNSEGDNAIALLDILNNGTLNINNGSTLSLDSLMVIGNCTSPFTIQKTANGADASISKTGYQVLTLSNVQIDGVDALGAASYEIVLSEVINGTGWTPVAANFYWINDGGNWNNTNQWSNSSGGVVSGCIPSTVDSVFFDANSFSLTNQTVVVDDTAYAGYLDWTTAVGTHTMRLDSSLYMYGNVLLNPNLTLNRGGLSSTIFVKDNSDLTTSSANVDCNFTVSMDNSSSLFQLLDDLITTDSSSIIQLNGRFHTNGNYLKTGSVITANNPGSGADQREIDIQGSAIDLFKEFNALGDTVLNLISTNSQLYIGDTSGFANNLITEGKNFDVVTLNFIKNSKAQAIKGSNQFNKLTITAGSEVYFQEGATQTVVDSLIAKGNCLDSITIHTLDTTGLSVANLDKAGTDYTLECLNLVGIENTGDQLTTYFSSDVSSNVNWDFDASPAITPSFQPDSTLSSFCFGQDVYFENNSTPYSGSISDLTFEWTVGDGSLPIQELTSTVEANKTGTQINYPQTAGTSSDALTPLTGWTETADPQAIFDPSTGQLNTTPGNQNMSYSFTVGYRFSLVNSTGNDAYLVDMDANANSVEYNYLPELKIFKNGAQFGVGSSQFAFPTHTFQEGTLTNGATQIGTDTVTFTLTAQSLDPADILTAQMGTDVSYVGYTNEPRWKDGSLATDNDVNVTYRIDIDTIYMRAIPTTPSYETTSLVHEFESSGDSIQVSLNAIDTRNFCEAKDTFYIDIIKPEPSLLASNTDTILCPNTEIEFEAYSPVDTTKFEFFYNGVSQNTPSVNDTLLTVYPIQDEDTISVVGYEYGCPSDTVPFFTYNLFAEPNFSWSNSSTNEIICEEDTVFFAATSPDSINSFQYLFNNSSVTGILDSIANYSTNTLSDLDSISLITIDTNSCRDTTSLTFTVNALPNTTLSESTGGNVICENDLVTFTAANATNYEFFVNNTSVVGPSATSTYSTDSLTNSDTVYVVGTSPQGCEYEAPSTYTYIVNPAPVLNMTSSDADNIICTGETVSFSASGAVAYEFFVNGVSAQGPSTINSYVTDTLDNNDVVTVVGTTSGCSGNVPSISITVNSAPTTTLTNSDNGDNEICQGTLVDFTATGATNYQFFVDGISQGPSSTANTFSSSTIQNGQTIEVVGESNGCLVSASNTFTVLSVPNVNMISSHPTNTICDGESISFTGSNAQNYEFFLNNSSVQGPTNNSVYSTTSFLTGTNDVYLVGASNNGCTDTSQVIQVDVNPIPTINVTSSDADNIICEGETVTFTATGGDNYQFILNGTPQTSMTPTNTFTTSNLLDGQTLVVNGELNGCASSSAGITTIVNPSPNVTLTSNDVDNIFCENEVVDFTATGANSYEFFVDGNSQGAPSAVNTMNSSGFVTGTYSIIVEGESNNCISSSSLSLTVNAVPSVSIVSSDPNNSICAGDQVTYTASGADLYEFFINGVSQGASSPSTTLNTTTLNDNDVVSVEGASGDGCLNTDQMTPIEVLPIPSVTLVSSDPNQQICDGESVTFTSSGATDYEFFINGVSQGPPSTTDNITTTGLQFNDVITVEGSSQGCSSLSNSIQFEVYGYPIVGLNNNEDTVLCVDELTNLSSTGANEYLFYVNGSPVGTMNASNNFQSILNNGDEVTVEGQTNGCSSFSTTAITFSVFNYPTINVVSSDPTLEICLNDTVTFNSTGANEYVYEINNLEIGANTSGVFETDEISNGDLFSVIGYNAHCSSTPVDFNFIVNEMNLSWSASPSNMICEGDQVDFTANGADEYEFFLNGVSQGSPSSTNIYSSNTLSHQDEVTFTGYDNNTSCTQAYHDFIIMSVLDEPVITPQSSTTFCEGDSVILVSNGSYGNEWYLDNNLISGETDTFYVADSTGSYTLQVTMGGDGDLWSQGLNAPGVFANGNSFNSDYPVSSTSGIQFTEISAGFDFLMGIDQNKLLHAWGDNATGQLGDGTFTGSTDPLQVAVITDVKTVATGSNSTMATTELGEVYVWGNNTDGQLGTGNTSVINFPFQNSNLANVDSIAAGRTHYVILRNDGTVLTVGNNDYGQLGNNSLMSSNVPVSLSLTNIVSVGAGEYSSYAVDNAGTLYVWGNNAQGQLGLGDQTNRLEPTNADLSNVISVQGGATHSIFLTSDNEAYAAGGNDYGQLAIGSQVNSTIPKKVDLQGVNMIAAGQYTTLLKRTDNSVFAAGNNTENQINSSTDTTIVNATHMTQLDGVTFVESSQNASHFLYGQQTTCVSDPVITDFLPSPDVNILSSGDTLSTDQPGASSYQWYFNGNPVAGGTSPNLIATSSGTYMVEVTYNNGCSSLSDDYYHSISNVDSEKNLTFQLYPNPTKNDIYLTWNYNVGLVNVTIIDNVGKVIQTDEINGTNKTITCTDLENGVYYLQLSTDKGLQTLRFVVNR